MTPDELLTRTLAHIEEHRGRVRDPIGGDPVTTPRTVKIERVDHNRTRIEIDGHDIANYVREISVFMSPLGPDRAVIELHLPEFKTLNAPDAEVLIDGDSAELLQRLGWTPPGGAS